MQYSLLLLLAAIMLFNTSCSHSKPLHPPTADAQKINFEAQWLNNVAKVMYETQKQYNVSQEASNMLWLEYVIMEGKKQGTIRSFDEEKWIREYYRDPLFKSPKTASQQEIRTSIGDYAKKNPPKLAQPSNLRLMNVEPASTNQNTNTPINHKPTKDPSTK